MAVPLVRSVQLSRKDPSISTEEGSFVVDIHWPDRPTPPQKEIIVCMHAIFYVQFLLHFQRATVLFDHAIKLAMLGW